MMITYDENSIKEELSISDSHVIPFSPPDASNASVTPSTEAKPATDVLVTVKRASESLSEAINRRTIIGFKTNPVAQAAVNRRLLGGFEGFNGELSRLWDKIGVEAQEYRARRLAKDRLRNDRQGRRTSAFIPDTSPSTMQLEKSVDKGLLLEESHEQTNVHSDSTEHSGEDEALLYNDDIEASEEDIDQDSIPSAKAESTDLSDGSTVSNA